jgi:hypothetical protein
VANYVDYDYWLQGYGEGDLSQPDRYVVIGYWDNGYAEYESIPIEASAAVTAISANTWYHVAATRENGTLRLFLNGSLDLTQASLTTDYNQTNNLQIGLSRDGSWPWVGYLDDLRITKGLARYTSSFTPTTSAFALQ